MREKTRGWQLVDAVREREIFEVKASHSMGAGEDNAQNASQIRTRNAQHIALAQKRSLAKFCCSLSEKEKRKN